MWGAKFKYTTQWNGIVNMFLGIPAILFCTIFLWTGLEGMFPWVGEGPKSILFGFGCLIASSVLLEKVGFGAWLNTLSAWLHIRRELKTPVTWKDAACLRGLFLADSEGNFYTLSEILKVDEAERRDRLVAFAKKAGRYRDA